MTFALPGGNLLAQPGASEDLQKSKAPGITLRGLFNSLK